MRDDMFELIIERPRSGSRWMKHARRARRRDVKVDLQREPDAVLRQIGMGRGAAMGRGRKMLNENLAPLRRYLEKQVNRPWDKVWFEISENLSTGSTVQQHVRDHISDFVAMRSFIKDGAVWLAGRYGSPVQLRDSHVRLYVDPRTGLLRKNKYFVTWQTKARLERAAAAKHRATRMRELGPHLQAHKLDDDCWWEVRLAPIPMRQVKLGNREFSIRDKFTDVVRSAKLSRLPPHELYGEDGVYAVAKRQLSRREIGDLGLRS
jgi:hypothetical protein